jgi:DNA-binding FadR family transcriptional regulator
LEWWRAGSEIISQTDTEPSPTPAELLEAELAAARLRPSRRLAAERVLAARTGLSRTAVRRWLDELERAGRVTRHVGRGTFVLPTESAAHLETSPAEILAARLLLEPQLLGLAVANATGNDIAEMRRWLALGEAADSYDEFERCDSRLHGAIAASTHNSLLIRLFNVINDSRDHPLWGSAKRRTFTPELRGDYQADHRQLVNAIDDRDPDRAALVMRQHLQRIRGALLGP